MNTNRLGSVRMELLNIQLALARLIGELDVIGTLEQRPSSLVPKVPRPYRKGEQVTCPVAGCGRVFKSANALGPHMGAHQKRGVAR